MTIDPINQVLIICVPFIVGLIISYAFFENSFTYLLYFMTIFIIVFVSLGIIDFYYISISVLIIAIIIYQTVEPELRRDRNE